MDDDAFLIIDDVPILDEHEGLTAADLERIAANNSRRIIDTGDLTPICIRHNQDDQAASPEVVGYADNFEVKDFGRLRKRKCIFCRMKFLKDKYEKVKQFPRRSVELWKENGKAKFIDPIALLGAETPRRDLGLLNTEKIIFSMEENESTPTTYLQGDAMNLDKETFMKELFEMLEKSDVFSWCRQQMSAESTKTEAEEAKTEESPKEKPEAQEDKKEVYRMERDQLATQVEKFRKETESIRTELDIYQKKARKSEIERDLIQLESEGFSFDRAEEMTLCEEMTPEHYGKHIGRIRKCYQRAPIGIAFKPAPMAAEGGRGTFTTEHMNQAIKMSQEKDISYEQAVAAVQAGTN